MNDKIKFSLIHLTVPAVVGLWLAIAMQLPLQDWLFPTQPYTQVTVLTEQIENNAFHFKATFFKNTCTFQFMQFYGNRLDDATLWEKLPYTDRNVPEGDRVQGWHTIDVDVPLINKYSVIELRTRHICTTVEDNKTIEEVVDKLFHSTNLQDLTRV